MPYINIKANFQLTQDSFSQIKSECGNLIKLLPGKSQAWLMVDIEDNKNLYFKGSKEKAVFCEVKLYGSANSSAKNALTEGLTNCLSNMLQVAPSRIYVAYFETNDWGWSGSNF